MRIKIHLFDTVRGVYNGTEAEMPVYNENTQCTSLSCQFDPNTSLMASKYCIPSKVAAPPPKVFRKSLLLFDMIHIFQVCNPLKT